MGGPVGDGEHIREDIVLVKGPDEFDRFLGPGQDEPLPVLPPDLAHFHFEAELLPAHFAPDVLRQFRGDPDILGKLFLVRSFPQN